ncbi:hypothetical protein ykris0001_41580 [Yersinia kristensenii ATCC 33638]|nr:hypothetical protein ykris0001_41580 [Yersinia kristensenii ATCC 33638]
MWLAVSLWCQMMQRSDFLNNWTELVQLNDIDLSIGFTQ